MEPQFRYGLLVAKTPPVDVAEFGNYIYILFAGFGSPREACIRRFDPIAETSVVVFSFPDLGRGHNYGGGIAVDPIANVLVIVNDYDVYRSSTGDLGSWVLDAALDVLLGTDHTYSLLTTRHDDDLIYAGNEDTPNANVLIKRTGVGAWAVELNIAPDIDAIGMVMTTEYDNVGNAVALYMQLWNWWRIVGETRLYRRPVAGAWALDWTGPPGPNGYLGVYAQSSLLG